MKTLLRLHGLWEAVDTGVADTDAEGSKKDARAMCLIQQGVSDVIFPKIAAAASAKETWSNLVTAYEGDTRMKGMKLQGLRSEFETLQMTSQETVQSFLTRVQNIVNQRKVLGDQVADETVMAKVLRSLTPEFDHVVAAIEESKDLSTYTLIELSGSLQTHESRLKRRNEVPGEQVFYARGDAIRGRGRGFNNFSGGRRGRGFNPRGGRGFSFRGGRISGNFSSKGGRNSREVSYRSEGDCDLSDFDTSDEYKRNVRCHNCNQMGHFQYECQEPNQRVKRCYYCKKVGHIQSQCIIKKREEE